MLRILLIVNNAFWSPTKGARQRSNHLWRALGALGSVEALYLPRFETVAGAEAERVGREFKTSFVPRMRRRGEAWPWGWIRPLAPARVDQLAHVLGTKAFYFSPDPIAAAWVKAFLEERSYDLIVGRYLQTTALAGVIGRHPLMVDVDDLDTDVARSQQVVEEKWGRRWLLGRHVRQLQRCVPGAIEACDHVWLTNQRDLQEVGELVEHDEGSKSTASLLPNIALVETEATAPRAAESRMLLVVGSLGYRPNYEGIERFLARVWPRVQEAVPGATFRIVGQGMSAAQGSRWGGVAGVEAMGAVEQLAPHYAACAAAVVPVFQGGGTKIKLLEALAYERTCVTSSHGLRGYEHVLRDGDALSVADSDIGFADACVKLLLDVELSRRLAVRGKEIVRKYFSFERFAAQVKKDVERVLRESQENEA